MLMQKLLLFTTLLTFGLNVQAGNAKSVSECFALASENEIADDLSGTYEFIKEKGADNSFIRMNKGKAYRCSSFAKTPESTETYIKTGYDVLPPPPPPGYNPGVLDQAANKEKEQLRLKKMQNSYKGKVYVNFDGGLIGYDNYKGIQSRSNLESMKDAINPIPLAGTPNSPCKEIDEVPESVVKEMNRLVQKELDELASDFEEDDLDDFDDGDIDTEYLISDDPDISENLDVITSIWNTCDLKSLQLERKISKLIRTYDERVFREKLMTDCVYQPGVSITCSDGVYKFEETGSLTKIANSLRSIFSDKYTDDSEDRSPSAGASSIKE